MLNSLYGRLGMKEIPWESKLKIVEISDSKDIYKNYNYSIFSKLSKDKVLVKYSSRINENLFPIPNS